MRNQIRISLDDRDKNILNKVKADNDLSSYSEAVSFLCEEYLTNEKINLIEERIALRVKKELSKEINIIKVRTGYIDKESKIILDLLNHIALQGNFDNDILFDTKNYSSRIYISSTERIQSLIEYYDQKKKDKQLESEE